MLMAGVFSVTNYIETSDSKEDSLKLETLVKVGLVKTYEVEKPVKPDKGKINYNKNSQTFDENITFCKSKGNINYKIKYDLCYDVIRNNKVIHNDTLTDAFQKKIKLKYDPGSSFIG